MNPPENTTLHFAWSEPMAADIARARRSVIVTALSMHPLRNAKASRLGALWDSLRAAVASGARVDVILPTPSNTHPATLQNGSAAAALAAFGARCHYTHPANLLHAKTVAVDSCLIWIGSGNWTAAAATHNHEAYVRAYAPKLAEELADHWRQFITP